MERPAVSKKARLKLERARAAKYDVCSSGKSGTARWGVRSSGSASRQLMGKGARRKLKPKEQLGVADTGWRTAEVTSFSGTSSSSRFKQRRKVTVLRA